MTSNSTWIYPPRETVEPLNTDTSNETVDETNNEEISKENMMENQMDIDDTVRYVDGNEFVLNTGDMIPNDHIIILHGRKQFLVRNDQINENGEIVLKEENAIEGFVYENEHPSVDESMADILPEENLEILQGKNDQNSEYDYQEEYLEDEDEERDTNMEVWEQFAGSDVTEQTSEYSGGDGCLVVVDDGEIENAITNVEEVLNADHYNILQQIPEGSENKLYAILKDGKLHIQEGNVSESSLITDCEQRTNFDTAFQTGIACSEQEVGSGVELERPVAGKNLLTGQTISLEAFLSKMAARDKNFKYDAKNVRIKQEPGVTPFFPKKITVGHTTSGKKIVGKILQIKRPGQDINQEFKQNFTALSPNTAESEHKLDLQATSSDSEVNTSHTDTSGILMDDVETSGDPDQLTVRTLCGLMELESVRQSLINRRILVRRVFKRIHSQTRALMEKSVKFYKGMFKKFEEVKCEDGETLSWSFIPYEGDDVEEPSTSANDQPRVTVKSFANISELNKAVLTLTVIEDEDGNKQTKVNIPDMDKTAKKCTTCQKQFRSQSLLRRHLRTAHDARLFECDLCMKRFIDASTLARHRHIHSGDKNHQCDMCPKAFNTAGSLKRHVTVHNPNLRPLQCLTCMQRFTDESSLKKHMLLHTGLKPFECDICFKRFVHSGDLNFHRKIHDPSKRYSCETCGKEFSRQSNLVRHMDIHKDNGNAFKCEICGCSYNFMSSLTRHIVSFHMKDS